MSKSLRVDCLGFGFGGLGFGFGGLMFRIRGVRGLGIQGVGVEGLGLGACVGTIRWILEILHDPKVPSTLYPGNYGVVAHTGHAGFLASTVVMVPLLLLQSKLCCHFVESICDR